MKRSSSYLTLQTRRPASLPAVPGALQSQSKTLLAPRSLSSEEARKARDSEQGNGILALGSKGWKGNEFRKNHCSEK